MEAVNQKTKKTRPMKKQAASSNRPTKKEVSGKAKTSDVKKTTKRDEKPVNRQNSRHKIEQKVEQKHDKINREIVERKAIKHEKQGFLLSTVDTASYDTLVAMNYSDFGIELWQKKRLTSVAVLSIIGIMASIALQKWFIALGGVAAGGALYAMEGSSLKSKYQGYKFERALQFAKFTSLVYPYLLSDSAGGTESRVYTSLSSVMARLDSEHDKKLLATLLNEMVQEPESKAPFMRYADKVAGSDFAMTFMETLYDIRMGSTNLDIIRRMGKESRRQIQSLSEDIMGMKLKKFMMYPTKVTMTAIIIILGCMVAIMMVEFKGMNFSF